MATKTTGDGATHRILAWHMRSEMKLALVIMLITITGCATISPEREIYNHGLGSIRRAEGNANERAAAEAHADVLRAFTKLESNLKENSADATARNKDMSETLHGQQVLSPKELGDVIGGLIDAAARADSHRLLDFRREISDRDNPDGFDPVRRAVLDRELNRRGIIARGR